MHTRALDNDDAVFTQPTALERAAPNAWTPQRASRPDSQRRCALCREPESTGRRVCACDRGLDVHALCPICGLLIFERPSDARRRVCRCTTAAIFEHAAQTRSMSS